MPTRPTVIVNAMSPAEIFAAFAIAVLVVTFGALLFAVWIAAR